MLLRSHPLAALWSPPPDLRARLERRFPGESYVATLWPRCLVHDVTGRPTEPYAFRAFTRGDESHLFVDATETPESIAWLLAHELSHQIVNGHPDAERLLAAGRPTDQDSASDVFHRVDPEELLADGIATNLFGRRLDRGWWRERVRRMVLP